MICGSNNIGQSRSLGHRLERAVGHNRRRLVHVVVRVRVDDDAAPDDGEGALACGHHGVLKARVHGAGRVCGDVANVAHVAPEARCVRRHKDVSV